MKIRRKLHTIITRVSHVELEKKVQYSKCEQRGAKLHSEASTGHSSPFNRKEKKRCQDSSLPQRRKCVQFVQKPKYSHKLYPLSNQALHPGKQTSPEKSNFPHSKKHPDARISDCQYKDNGHNTPDSKCEPRERKGQEILPRASIG